jgi:hypothetical protein
MAEIRPKNGHRARLFLGRIWKSFPFDVKNIEASRRTKIKLVKANKFPSFFKKHVIESLQYFSIFLTSLIKGYVYEDIMQESDHSFGKRVDKYPWE